MFYITNESKDLFLTGWGGSYSWTKNLELAYGFKTEKEAAIYEEESASDFLNFDTDVRNYINEI